MLALPEDVLFEEADVADAASGRCRPAGAGRRRARPAPRAPRRRRAAARDRRRGRLDARRPARTSSPSARRTRCPSPPRSAARTTSTTTRDVYAGHLTIGMDPGARAAGAGRRPAPRGRRPPRRRHDARLHAPRRSPPAPAARPRPPGSGPSSARSTSPSSASSPASPRLAAALRALEPVEPRWREWTSAARADYLANLEHRPLPGDLDLGEVMATLRERLPADAIITSGAGNFTVWAHRFYEFSVYPSQLAPRSGAMAYGVPAALAAKAVFPERTVVCIAGDGDFVMSGQELATAVQYDLPIVVLVVNNGMLGTIRMHQERLYPGPRRRHRPRQSGLRGLRGGVRRARRDGRADGGLRGGARARARRRPAGARRAPRRPGGDLAAAHDHRAPRGKADEARGVSSRRDERADQPLHGRRAGRRPALRLRHRPGRRRRRTSSAATTSWSRRASSSRGSGACWPPPAPSRKDVVKVTLFLTDVDDRPGDQPDPAGVLRRDPPGEHARRGEPARDPGREARGRGRRDPAVTDTYNAVITTVEPDGEPRPGPLSGRTLLVKDLIDVAGVRTTYGSQDLRRTRARAHGAGGAAGRRRRRRDRGQGAPAGVRVERHRPEPVVRHRQEPGAAPAGRPAARPAAMPRRSPPACASSGSARTPAARSGSRRPAATPSA